MSGKKIQTKMMARMPSAAKKKNVPVLWKSVYCARKDHRAVVTHPLMPMTSRSATAVMSTHGNTHA